MSDHNKFLRRCFELAKLGETHAFPNPIVGCVIVHEGKIIREGFHERYGGPHAEVNAIRDTQHPNSNNPSNTTSILNTEDQFKESTIYISLEPCAHHGKTPPCADLIIRHKFKRLVFSSYDPNPQVSGQGIQRIRAAGIEVIEPKDLDQSIVIESDWLNRVFFKIIRHREEGEARRGDLIDANGIASSHATRVPRNDDVWTTLKIAATAEGSMLANEKLITNSRSRQDVHRLRSTHQLVVTSIPTIRADNPQYTVRHHAEELELLEIKNPDIVIIKSKSNFTDMERKSLNIFKNNARTVFEYQVDKANPKSLEKFIHDMVNKGYKKIMIEAGPTLTKAFIDSGLVDEIIYYSVLRPSGVIHILGNKDISANYKLEQEEIVSGLGSESKNVKLQFIKHQYV